MRQRRAVLREAGVLSQLAASCVVPVFTMKNLPPPGVEIVRVRMTRKEGPVTLWHLGCAGAWTVDVHGSTWLVSG